MRPECGGNSGAHESEERRVGVASSPLQHSSVGGHQVLDRATARRKTRMQEAVMSIISDPPSTVGSISRPNAAPWMSCMYNQESLIEVHCKNNIMG